MKKAGLLFSILFILMISGLPISCCIELSNIAFLSVTKAQTLTITAQKIVAGIDSFTLMAVPLFMLTGYIMEMAGLSQRLIEWVSIMFGHISGTIGVVTIVACAIFAALTGSSMATVVAIGSIMWPILLDSGYSRSQSAGLIAVSGGLGSIIPPSIGMIIYSSTMNVSASKLFMAALTPGILMAVGMIVLHIILVKNKWNIVTKNKTYSTKEKFIKTVQALPVLFLPILILGGIYSGIFTPTEAGCIGIFYSILISIIYKTFSFEKIKSSLFQTLKGCSGCVVIVGMASLFGYILSITRIPSIISSAIVQYVNSKTVYLLVLFVIMAVVGCLMETTAAIVIIAPVLIPVGIELGLTPLHLAMAFCLNLICGAFTPPFGQCLFITSSVTEEPFGSVVKGALPYLMVCFFVVLLTTLVPEIGLWLPNMLY